MDEPDGLFLLVTVIRITQAHEDQVSRNVGGVAFHLIRLQVQHQSVN